MIRKLRYGLIAGVAALVAAAGGAAAEDCTGSLRAEALGVSLWPLKTIEDLQAALKDMDLFVSDCPQDPWINALGAEMDMRVYNQLVAANNNQVNQQAFDFLHRAFVRSDAYIAAPSEARENVHRVQTQNGYGDLTYSATSTNRANIIKALMLLGKQGQVHPYLKAETPKVCTGWLSSDAQTVGYAIEAEADLVFRPFLEAVVEACSGTGDARDRTPLAVVARGYYRLVDKGATTDPALVQELLLKARNYRDAYLEGRSSDMIYSEFDMDRLDRALRQHGVDPEAGFVPRDQWFTPQHIRSDKLQYTLAMAFSEAWAAIAADMAAETLTLAAAGTRYTRFAFDLLDEGKAAGLEAETQAVLVRALEDVQESRVRAPAMEHYDLPPQWLYNVVRRPIEAPERGN